MNKLAVELNNILESSPVGSLLSPLGQRLFFPKEGIVSQAAEASKHATTYNATAGMAFNDGEPLILPTVQDNLPRLTPTEAVSYAPTGGDAKLRSLWKEEMIRKNPGINEDLISLPVVVPGLTAGINYTAELFAAPGDPLILPDMFWGNYRLMFETRLGAELHTFPFFNPQMGINIQGLGETIRAKAREGKALVLLNFPNNPTGYSPTKDEALELARVLTGLAQEGYRLVVICDDAYFGLFYEGDIFRQSFFSLIYQAHENLLAVKVDGATKEDFLWGFRVGFLTFGARGLGQEHYEALNQKLMGAIRGTISNSSRIGQTILYKELSSLVYHGIKIKYNQLLEQRYKAVKEILSHHTEDPNLRPLPFNSGYFMTFEMLRGSAEDLRKRLLKEEGIGTIAIGTRYLRIAFSAVDLRDLKDLYTKVYENAAKV